MPSTPHFSVLAATPAMRPVFMIVMGTFLLLTVWRMTRGTTGWTPRVLMSGAFLLAFGYAVVMPLYQAGVLLPVSRIGAMPGDPDTAIIWHAVKTFSMNAGWLLFGLGLAMHAGLFETTKSPAPIQAPRTSPVHETVA